MRTSAAGLLGLSLLLPRPSAAQAVKPAHDLGPVVMASPALFTSPGFVTARALSNGRVLVNDRRQRRLFILDEKLQNPRVVLDSAPGQPNSYGTQDGVLLAFLGDSSLFVDPASRSMLVIDPAGVVARVTSMPGRGTTLRLALSGEEPLTFSSIFGLVERMPLNVRPPTPPAGGAPITVMTGDSALAVATDLVTRKVDTLARLATGRGTMRTIPPAGSARGAAPPFDAAAAVDAASLSRTFDAWAVTTDGSLAVIRGIDYHLEFLGANGARTVTPRLPYEWKRNTDADKQRVADSINTDRERLFASSLARWIADSAAGGRTFPPGTAQSTIDILTRAAATRPTLRRKVEPNEIPDYYPALPGATTLLNPVIVGDADNNVWIQNRGADMMGRSTPTYDVVSREGVTIDRVRIPATGSLASFGPGGAVYLIGFYPGPPGTPPPAVRPPYPYRIERVTIR
jgi:hypothetical protein